MIGVRNMQPERGAAPVTAPTHAVPAAADRWRQQDDESDQAYQDRMVSDTRIAALELLCATRALGWGSGDPYMDAVGNLMLAAEEYALFFRYRQPKPPGRPARKSLGPGLMRAVWDRDGWECRHCGSHRDLTVDHITPVVLGGSDEMGNLQTLCKSCNSRKGARV
jgi:hypothetical protein